MNRKELINLIAEELKISKSEAGKMVEAVLCNIEKSLVQDGEVNLHGFGNFKVKERKARTGRNPRTKETITIKASKVVIFRPAKVLKESLQ